MNESKSIKSNESITHNDTALTSDVVKDSLCTTSAKQCSGSGWRFFAESTRILDAPWFNID